MSKNVSNPKWSRKEQIRFLTKELSATEKGENSLYRLLQNEFSRRYHEKDFDADQDHRDARFEFFLKCLGFTGIKVFSPINELHHHHQWGWLKYKGTFKFASDQGTFELKIGATLSHEAKGMSLPQEFSILYSQSSFDFEWTASDVNFDFDVRKKVIIGFMAKGYCDFYGCNVDGVCSVDTNRCDNLRQTVGDLMFSHFYPNSPGDNLYHRVSDIEDRIFTNTIYDHEDSIFLNRETDLNKDNYFSRIVTQQEIAKLEQDE